MKLGYLTGFSEDECKTASRIGYDCLEVSSGWDLDGLRKKAYRKAEAGKARELLDRYGLSVSALAIYWAIPKGTRPRIAAYKSYIKFCTELGVDCITALTQCDPTQGLDENVAAWAAVFSEVAPVAEDAGVKIAFENWPGLQGNFPPVGSINFAFNPTAWEKMFDAVPSPPWGWSSTPRTWSGRASTGPRSS